jgi:hypothetical protein
MEDACVKILQWNRMNDYDEHVAFDCIKDWNPKNPAPLSKKRIEELITAVYDRKTSYMREEDESMSTRLVALAVVNAKEFFTDQYSNPYAAIEVDTHIETYQIRVKVFKSWLSSLLWKDEGKAANSMSIHSALNVLEAMATHDGKRRELHNRVAWHDGAIYYDLSNEDWEAVKITTEGWEIVKPPILFKRYAHQQPQVNPIKGGDLKELLRFANIKGEDHQHIFLVKTVTDLVPNIPHPIDLAHGAQGSAKSTRHKAVKKLIDPSALELVTFPRDNHELVQKLEHHYYCNFDNVTGLQKWQSDALCRASTGEGFSKRQLYTDNDDVIFKYRRCVAVNGINIAGTSPDFLDRSILFEMIRVSKKNRLTEKELWKSFEAVRPLILGAMFDALSEAMKLMPTIELRELPRMADFTVWGEAVSRALGYGDNVFINAYSRSVGAMNQEAIEAHILGPPILALMDGSEEWVGTPTELHSKLEELAEKFKININARGWPKAANVLTRRLNELKTNLEDEGIRIIRDREGSKGDRILRICRIPSESSDRQVQERLDADNTPDDIIAGEILSVKPSGDFEESADDTGSTDDNLPYSLDDPLSQADRLKAVLKVIKISCEDSTDFTITTDEIRAKLSSTFHPALEQDLLELKEAGFIYEPKPGHWRAV